jgi:hypothetical protein
MSVRKPFGILRSLFSSNVGDKRGVHRSRALLTRAVVDVLERRQLMSVTSATITPDSTTVTEGAEVSVRLAATTDTHDTTKWVINPGDGTGDQDPIYIPDGDTAGFGYYYSGEEGQQYQMTAKVYDVTFCTPEPYPSAFNATPQTFSVVDADLHDVGNNNDFNYDQNTATTAHVGDFTDDYSAAPQSDYTASIHWGDGATSGGIITLNSDGSYGVDGTHTYTGTADSYTVTTVVTDVGGSSVTLSATATKNVKQIIVNPNSVTVAKGATSAAVAVTATVNGVDSTPPAVTYDTPVTFIGINTNSPGDGTESLTVTVDSNAVSGTYSITIKAWNDNSWQSTKLTVIIP